MYAFLRFDLQASRCEEDARARSRPGYFLSDHRGRLLELVEGHSVFGGTERRVVFEI